MSQRNKNRFQNSSGIVMALSKIDLQQIRSRVAHLRSMLAVNQAQTPLIAQELSDLLNEVEKDFRNHRIQRAELKIIQPDMPYLEVPALDLC